MMNAEKRPIAAGGQGSASGFSLIELLVVVVIIAVLASIAAPSLRGLGQANLMSVANRQVLDDLNFARLRAINERTHVYMVFVPPANARFQQHLGQLTDPSARRQFTNLFGGQLTTYALFADRTIGDQPGVSRPRYLSEWKSLPEGLLFPAFKLDNTQPSAVRDYDRSMSYGRFPFPTQTSPLLDLPYVGFDAQGRLLGQKYDEVLALAKGSVLVSRRNSGEVDISRAVDARVVPANNHTNNFIRINWLTGRVTVERPTLR